MFEGISMEKLLVIAVVIMILFGSNKIPGFMRSLGKGMREFNDGKKGLSSDLDKNSDDLANKSNPNVITDLDHEPINKA